MGSPNSTLQTLIAAACVAGCASATPLPDIATENAQLAAADFEEISFETIEQDAIRQAKDHVQREGDVLVLRPANGEPVRLQNARKCLDDPNKEAAKPENCHFYRLIAYLQTRRTYVVEEGFYEGRAVLIVNEVTGRKTQLSGVPHYSPDNRLFVVFDNCEANGDIQMEIWRVERDGAVREWTQPCPPDDLYYVTSIRWAIEGKIDLNLHSSMSIDHPDRSYSAVLERKTRGWELRVDRTHPK